MIYGFNDKKEKVNLLNMFYPVGAIYESADASFNPNESWGGTWVEISGKFLLAAGGSHSVGDTGGAESVSYTPSGTVGGHTLTINEIPSHNHSINIESHSTQRGILSDSTGLVNDFVCDPVAGNTGAKGGNAAHNHSFTGTASNIATMPPFEVVKVWKRTA